MVKKPGEAALLTTGANGEFDALSINEQRKVMDTVIDEPNYESFLV